MSRKYNNSRFNVKNIIAVLRGYKDYESAPAVTVTLPAIVLMHLVTLQKSYAYGLRDYEDTPKNRDLYAQYVQDRVSKGKEDDEIDEWETWARRKATAAFVATHAKNAETGKWEYQGENGEIMLKTYKNISDQTDDILMPLMKDIDNDVLASALEELAGLKAELNF